MYDTSKSVVAVSKDGSDSIMVIKQNNYKDNFSGQIKVTTQWGIPIMKKFTVKKRNSYSESAGPCDSAKEIKKFEAQENVKTQQDCQKECD